MQPTSNVQFSFNKLSKEHDTWAYRHDMCKRSHFGGEFLFQRVHSAKPFATLRLNLLIPQQQIGTHQLNPQFFISAVLKKLEYSSR